MIMPDSRVKVFDHLLFKNDRDTPIAFTVRPATVVCRYGRKWHTSSGDVFVYDDLIDVLFDHRPESVSHGHFTEWAKEICDGGN